MGGKKQRDWKEVEEWEKKEEEARKKAAFGGGAGLLRSPQQQGRSSEGVEKRKVADTSFEGQGEGGREKKKAGEVVREGCNGNCKEIVGIITEAIRKEREIWKEEMREAREMWREELREMKEMWRQEREKLRQRIAELEGMEEKRERKERRNNIIIKGKEFQEKGEVVGFLKEALGVEAEVKESFMVDRVGKLALVRLGNIEEKSRVMRNKNKLRNGNRGVFIDDDLTREERRIQKSIRERVSRERERGNMARVGYQKAVINGEIWRWSKEKEDLERLEEAKK